MGKPKTPTWLSKLKQVGEALKVQTKPGGSPSSSYVSSPRDSGAGAGINNGDESPAGSAGFVRRSLEAPELARSLSLKRAKARAADRSGGGGAAGADPDAAGSPRPAAPVSPSSGGTGHRLSRSIDALYALSQKKEEEEAAAAAAAAKVEQAATPPASGHGTGRNLDQATMALLADSLARTKVAKQKELAERAARAAQQLKARAAAAAAAAAAASAVSDDSATSSDRPPLGFAARASPSSSSVQGGGVPYSNAAAARRRPPSVRRSPQRRYGDAGSGSGAGASSLCTSEDDRPPFHLPPNATTASMSCSDDAWDNSSRHSRVTGEDAAWEVAAAGAGSDVWGSDLFVKLRALKQLYSKDTRQDEEEEEEEGDEDGDSDSDTNDARSDFMDDDDDDGWDTSDEASGGDDRHHHHLGGDVYMVPGWATPSRAVPTTSRRQQLQASPSRSFAVPRGGDNFMASPSRRNANMGGPPPPPSANRKDRHYRGYDQDDYVGEAQEKLFWKEEPATTTTTRRRPGADSKKLRHQQQQQQQQRSGSKQHNTNLSCFLPTDVSGVVRESVAMVKYSQDPYLDFRHSMAEMILEKDIHQPADLEELLHCYLTLNSPRQYHLIKKAFFDTWNELLSRRSRSFWGAV